MRGNLSEQNDLFNYTPIEEMIPKTHPLRKIKNRVDQILSEMDRTFEKLYSNTGRPSIPPEQLLKALFLQVLYTIRSEGQLIEHLHYNFLYRWFVGLPGNGRVWEESVFTKNRKRLLEGEVANEFFARVLQIAESERLVSKEHFSVDGTLIEAWASLKSLTEKNNDEKDSRKHDDDDKGNPSIDFKGEKRSNDTHESKTDAEARIYTKSKGVAAKLNFMGHVVMENRNGLAVDCEMTDASYHAEHEAGLAMVDRMGNEKVKKTMGGDKHYDNFEYCDKLREKNVTPHVSQNIHSRRHHSAIDGRTTRHPGYDISVRKRKRIEEIFGWLKTIGPMRRMHFRGKKKVGFIFKFSVAVCNLVRICNLTPSLA